jgi:hypothetical protein
MRRPKQGEVGHDVPAVPRCELITGLAIPTAFWHRLRHALILSGRSARSARKAIFISSGCR